MIDALKELGVRPGDTLMVHASLRKIGRPATEVLAALDAAVGPEGTLLMMTSGIDADPYDPANTPVDPDNGYLAEAFRTAPGSIFTDHPEGRFSARGARAKEILRDPPWNDYYGPGSPLHHLCEMHGKVLRLGSDEATVTLLHYAEYLANIPHKRRAKRTRRLLDGSVRTIECLDDCDGIVEWHGEDYFGLILREYLATGRATRGTVGGAPSESIAPK